MSNAKGATLKPHSLLYCMSQLGTWVGGWVGGCRGGGGWGHLSVCGYAKILGGWVPELTPRPPPPPVVKQNPGANLLPTKFCHCKFCTFLISPSPLPRFHPVHQVDAFRPYSMQGYWGFETQGVVPDIVTLGKPIGNGFPLAAVVVKRHIARSFDDCQYFNTAGGNPVSCAAGLAVLESIDEDDLQENARAQGEYCMQLLEVCP